MLDVFVRDYSAPATSTMRSAHCPRTFYGTPNNLLQCSSLIIGA